MKADTLHHHHLPQYHYNSNNHHHSAAVAMASVPAPQQQQPNHHPQQRVVYLHATCPIEDQTLDHLGGGGGGHQQQNATDQGGSPRAYHWSRSLSLGGHKRSQSLGRDTSAPPSLHKNSIYNKTISWLRNLRTTSSKNRTNNIQSDTAAATTTTSSTTTTTSTKTGTSSTKDRTLRDTESKFVVRTGAVDPDQSFSQDVAGHSLSTSGHHHHQHHLTQDTRHYKSSGTSKYRHSVIGNVSQEPHYPGDASFSNRSEGGGGFEPQPSHGRKGSLETQSRTPHSIDHYPRDTVEPHYQHSTKQFSREDIADTHYNTSASRYSSGDVSGVCHGIDNPGFSESNDKGPTDNASGEGGEGSSGGNGKRGPSSVGSTVTRILKARLFGRAKSSISLHLERATPSTRTCKAPTLTSSATLPSLTHLHPSAHHGPHPHEPGGASRHPMSASALNLGTDYAISAVKLRPKKGQCDNKHVYVVNKDTKPSRPRSCATLPRDAKLGVVTNRLYSNE
nr:hypothetical protein BaRGS_005962 [Batillaria attramentaria]